MKFHADCAACLVTSSLNKASQITDQAKLAAYMRRVCEIVAETDVERESAPHVDAKIIRLRREMLNLEEDYVRERRDFNALLTRLYPELKARAFAAADPLRAALALSMAGNYIDFGVLKEVSTEKLTALLDEAAERSVDAAEYARLADELDRARTLVFLHDNCGEIVLDKLLIEVIRARNAKLQVLSVVRGAPILNDATLEDAREIGLDAVAELAGNGLADFAGTDLERMPPALAARLRGADLLIAKGQGNFETLIGCGLNLYYLFLSKCPSYTRWFGFERFGGVLANERRMSRGSY